MNHRLLDDGVQKFDRTSWRVSRESGVHISTALRALEMLSIHRIWLLTVIVYCNAGGLGDCVALFGSLTMFVTHPMALSQPDLSLIRYSVSEL